ncbi:MAG: Rap1a/Tai family immunity protein, partial [Chromatiaceae bacterium]
ASLDYHHAITADGEGRITCPPGTVTRADVAVAFVEWAEVNTDKVGDQPPVHAVMQAMEEKWPCE